MDLKIVKKTTKRRSFLSQFEELNEAELLGSCSAKIQNGNPKFLKCTNLLLKRIRENQPMHFRIKYYYALIYPPIPGRLYIGRRNESARADRRAD